MKHLLLLLTLAFTINVNAQDTEKVVTLVASGQGKTQDEAKQNALRSAIEQAFGAFISSNTTILNDKLVRDEIVSVTNGNIQKFEILSENVLPNGIQSVLLNATVSISKLTTFSQAKGIKVEFEGNVFSSNIKIQLLNESSEINIINELVLTCFKIMQQSFDYSVQIQTPRALDNVNWGIPISITANTNSNIEIVSQMLIKTLSGVCLSSKELYEYQSMNKSTSRLYIYYKNIKHVFSFRKKETLHLIASLFNNEIWEYCFRSFEIDNGLENKIGVGSVDEIMWNYHYKCCFTNEMYIDAPAHSLNGLELNLGSAHAITTNWPNIWRNGDNTFRVFMLEPNKIAAILKYEDKKTISQIDKLKEYVIKPIGIRKVIIPKLSYSILDND